MNCKKPSPKSRPLAGDEAHLRARRLLLADRLASLMEEVAECAASLASCDAEIDALAQT